MNYRNQKNHKKYQRNAHIIDLLSAVGYSKIDKRKTNITTLN